MTSYLTKAKELTARFSCCDLQHIHRTENVRADRLAKLATSQIEDLSPHIHIETIDARGIEELKLALSVELKLSWMDSIFDYLTIGALFEGKSTTRKVTHQTPHYVLYDKKLYKRSFTLSLLKCLPFFEVDYALRKVHKWICGNHLDDRALAYKILRQGYYWSTIHKDAIEHVKRCDAYQKHTLMQHQPATEMIAIAAPWPFA